MAVPDVPRPLDGTLAGAPTISGTEPGDARRCSVRSPAVLHRRPAASASCSTGPGRWRSLLLLRGLGRVRARRSSSCSGSRRSAAPTTPASCSVAAVFLAVDRPRTQVLFGVRRGGRPVLLRGRHGRADRPREPRAPGDRGVAALAGIGTASRPAIRAAASWSAVTVGTISLTLSALSSLGRANRELQAARHELAEAGRRRGADPDRPRPPRHARATACR